ncbi:MAG: right-handed parallel beta-helix repeat-containing protein [Acidimicrobiaceae bacterium]|nr:right-handed parallel beta-helix repeat-containing protein [Acidimicrobiaceae bacterium]
MKASGHRAAWIAATATALFAGGGMLAMPAASADQLHQAVPRVLYASPSVNGPRVGVSCQTAGFATIGAAVAAAKPGATVVACPGTYHEDVVITSPITLIGKSATIDATGLTGAPTGAILGQAPYNGITIESSHVTVEGFKVEGAEGEGILAANPDPQPATVAGTQLFTGTPLTDVRILNNDVTGNDLGNGNPASPYRFCTPAGGSDCGEGIHLLSVANSLVLGNKSIGNSGGILLTDEFGPTHDNRISGNLVLDNVLDCGITIPSHSLGIDPTTGQPDPTFGGVYRNTVTDNIVTGNGTQGFGAGIGVFAPAPFSASYDNLISGNIINGNGLAGISVHSHAPNAYVDGNTFTRNVIGTNNVSGKDGADVSPKDTQTTGILIWSAASLYHFTVTDNIIFRDAVGVWFTSSTIDASGLATNHFHDVATPVDSDPS